MIHSEEETREGRAGAEVLLAGEVPVKDNLVQETSQAENTNQEASRSPPGLRDKGEVISEKSSSLHCHPY